jgi:hypothetical protein
MRLTAMLAVVLLLTSCARERIVIQEVKVPVPVSCIETVPEVRQMESGNLVKEDSTFDKVKAVLIDIKQLQSENNILRAALSGCLN